MGDAEHGKTLFKKLCATCHTVEQGGKHRIGPNLFGIYGRTCGTIPGFKYTEAMKTKGATWDDKSLDVYLEYPAKYIPGTRMAFMGTKKPEDRRNIIAYLKTLK